MTLKINKELENLIPELENLSYRVREMLKTTILEDQRKGSFVRIYPSYQSDIYDNFFVESRPLNKLQYKYLYDLKETKMQEYLDQLEQSTEGNEDSTMKTLSKEDQQTEGASPIIPLIKGSNINERIKNMGIDNRPRQTQRENNYDMKRYSGFKLKKLQNKKADLSFDSQKPRRLNSNGDVTYSTQPQNSSMDMTKYSSNPSSSLKFKDVANRVIKRSKNSPEKVRSINVQPQITGDEGLIEYIDRLVIAIKCIRESSIKKRWRESIEKFIKHYVWHTSDNRRKGNGQLWSRLESRLIEMKERRKRLVLSLITKDRDKKITREAQNAPADGSSCLLRNMKIAEK